MSQLDIDPLSYELTTWDRYRALHLTQQILSYLREPTLEEMIEDLEKDLGKERKNDV